MVDGVCVRSSGGGYRVVVIICLIVEWDGKCIMIVCLERDIP